MSSLVRYLFLFFLGLSLVAAAWFALYVFTPGPGSGEVLVTIPKGAGVRQIHRLLAQEGLLTEDLRFLALVRLLREINRKDPPNIRAGEFSIPLGLNPLELIRFLHLAKPVHHRITLAEGLNLRQIAAIFSQEGWGDEERFIALCYDPEFIKTLGLEVESLEGYLFPETYTLIRGETSEALILTSMVRRFLAVWDSLDRPDHPDHRHLNRHQLLTLASIVEKETGAAHEREIIAGVFYNRLRRGMRLQSDPTTIYGIPHFEGKLTRTQLREATPYNTYVIHGLPPGPICNPGQAALKAVLEPAEVPYLYFVSKNDGSHYFSRTYEEHNRAVWQYQRQGRER
jgi:UPF0755 protein